jgi:hypothetical protein
MVKENEEIEKILEKQREEIEKLKRRARRQKWWNVYFAWK